VVPKKPFLSVYDCIFVCLAGACLVILVPACRPAAPEKKQMVAYELWPSRPPAHSPFVKSKDITGIAFTGRHKEYADADTWYPSWATDGNLYSPYTDGTVDGIKSVSVDPKLLKANGQPETTAATTGQAKIIGDDPLSLQITSLGVHAASPSPYGGRYPCGSLVYNGYWYYGTYTLDELNGECGNWCIQGPFVGFRISKDLGRTWTDTLLTPKSNLFKETGKGGAKVKMGAPHFVDFGKNMEHSPDGKAYLVAHGATRPEAKHSWISGDQIYLARVTPSPENMNDLSQYEFFAGHDGKGQAKWSRRFADIKPLVEWNDRTGCVTVTYDAPLKKYLMCVTHAWPTVGTMDTYILEADQLTGPWRLVTYMERFGEQGYFVNIPSKFISADGRTAWLSYSANFTKNQKTNPPGGRYALCLQEIKLVSGDTAGIPTVLPPP
jgi:hypothetical protein